MASRPPAETLYTVRVEDGSSKISMLSEPMTLQQRFLKSRIQLSRFDVVQPPLSTRIRGDLTVRIVRDGLRPVQVNRAEPGRKIISTSRIPEGKEVKIRTGSGAAADGESNRFSNDIVLIGKGRATPKNKIFHLVATAYSPDIRDCWPYSDGITAIGLKAGFGVAAIDRRVIPLGTRIYVEGYGFAIASDLGGAIRGRRIDLCFDTHEEAKVYGRRRVKVYLLD
ncbi:3D domain-containing protein [bacterium]|nr:3D domain-containing protein [bacterium]